jgi:hypothetical protein
MQAVASLVRSGKASGRILLDGLARVSGMSELAGELAGELVIARLTAAMDWESGRLKTAAPSYCPNIQ